MSNSFERRPILTTSIILLVSFTFIIVVGEIICRTLIDYHIDYYTSVTSKPGTKVVKPYGVHYFNFHGYSDDEFDLEDSRPRIGYIGDSVSYGTGAGQGYRISDLLKQAFPMYQHFNLSHLKNGVQDIEEIIERAKPFELGTLIYIMNLNDILPYIDEEDNTQSTLRIIRGIVYETIDVFRGKSYFYNYFRTALKNALHRLGFESHGFTAFELFPEKYSGIIEATTSRIKQFNHTLNERGMRLCVVISPYEMQISEAAEEQYWSHGIKWGNSFVARGTQKHIVRFLKDELEVLDGYYAFVDPENVQESRRQNGLGQFFVYDRGDKLDWNHPNRQGHRKIAEYMTRTGFCGL